MAGNPTYALSPLHYVNFAVATKRKELVAPQGNNHIAQPSDSKCCCPLPATNLVNLMRLLSACDIPHSRSLVVEEKIDESRFLFREKGDLKAPRFA
ncbi:hypothetical protein Q1695_004559 [Nippostrongylus brasiliensis]|nr:hypothetical protein Q1695_004559 [Nippostrongylus brasiliensis]